LGKIKEFYISYEGFFGICFLVLFNVFRHFVFVVLLGQSKACGHGISTYKGVVEEGETLLLSHRFLRGALHHLHLPLMQRASRFASTPVAATGQFC
jgi:hypothetical protein